MSVKKTIKEEFSPLYAGFNKLANDLRRDVSDSLLAFDNKLQAKKAPSFKSRLIALRNWLTHVLLWAILSLLLSSCFVSGRTIHVATPKVSIEADTATAFTLPYKNNSVTY